jgi:phosphoesterase RecJ-like protein
MNFKINQIEEAKELINKSKRISVFSHRHPDGDAIGSAKAMGLYLKGLGKDFYCFVPTKIPPNLEFLNKENIVQVFDEDVDKDYLRTSDLYIFLDFNDTSRIENIVPYLTPNAKTILIDHHQEPKIHATHAFVDTSYPATAQMLFDFFGSDYPYTKEMAEALYVGIFTDTGSFQYERTVSSTFNALARLVETNINVTDIADAVLNQNTMNSYRLLGLALAKIELHCDGKFSIMHIKREDFIATNSTQEDTEGFTWYLLSIKGVEAGALMIENTDAEGEIRLSLRSKRSTEIRSIATKLGGGGHNQASGARVKNMTLKDLKNYLVSEMSKKW